MMSHRFLLSSESSELEFRTGYRFHNREYLRRALTCQSAINERHPDATTENFQTLEFLGDAALKYAVAAILYTEQNGYRSPGAIHNNVKSFIINSNLSRIGRELNLSRYIIKGRSVMIITDKMLGDAVEAILGAIVVDQLQQGNSAENVLFDVISRLFSINRQIRSNTAPPLQNNHTRKTSSYCKCFCFILTIILNLILVMFFVVAQGEL